MSDSVSFTDDIAIVDLSRVGTHRASGTLTVTAKIDDVDGPLPSMQARGVSLNTGVEYVFGSFGIPLADALSGRTVEVYVSQPVAEKTNRTAGGRVADDLIGLARGALEQVVDHVGFHHWYLHAALRYVQFVRNPERERWVQERAKALARWTAQVGSSATADPDYEEEQRHVREVMEEVAISTEAIASVAVNPVTPEQSRIAVTLLVSGHSLLDSIEAARRI